MFSLLLAWVHEYSRRTETSRVEQRDALARVVRSGAADLVQLITRMNFASFSDRELYFLLREQPADQKSAANWAQLSRLAAAIGRDAEALESMEQAVRMTPAGVDTWADLNRERIHLLLTLQRADDAAAVADEIEAARGVSVRLLAQLGDLFGTADRLEAADGYYLQALEIEELNESDRYGLLTRQARWHAGPTRWRLLLEAAQLLPVGNDLRDNLVRLVTQELTDASHAETAGELVAEVDAVEIAVALKLRQAELTVNPGEAADIGITLYEDRQLPGGRLDWLMETLLTADRHNDVIEILELYLRRGVSLDVEMLTHLRNACRAADRTQDAIRVTSNSRESRATTEPTR